MPKVTPCLWFDGQAEEAARFYTSVFKNSKIKSTTYWGNTGPGPKGSVLTVLFDLDGAEFMALNGGPEFKFSEAISLSVECKDQREIDEYWEKLSMGGEKGQCGWLKDKFGVSWQVVPSMLSELMGGGDAARGNRVMTALMRMNKLDIAALRRAGENVAA
jgi:predicted 3-demethylubiquinone-9 3-methyltransferase (glyoxalase superfamily)